MATQERLTIGHFSSIPIIGDLGASLLDLLRSVSRGSGKKEKNMNINELATRVAKIEGKKKEMSIAQIKEVLKCINKISEGMFYKWVRSL